MSDQDAQSLQFDNAEYDTPAPDAPTCAACRRPIPDAYYEIFGSVVCESCRDAILASREGGSKLLRFLRAGIYGAVAAIAGFAVYFGVLKIANLEIGLISILVGLMVGKAVHKGSNGRGGWVYQLLAVFLTYSAIVASYSALIVPEMISQFREKRVAEKKAAEVEKGGAEAKLVEKANVPAPAREQALEPKPEAINGGRFALLVATTLVLVMGYLYALPIMVGFTSPIGLLIIAFALWEAWKINKRVPIVINGPFAVGGNVGDLGPPETGGHA